LLNVKDGEALHIARGLRSRVAQSAEAQKRRCTKILVVDENLDPQHTLFCREIVFVANYALSSEIFVSDFRLKFLSKIFV